MRKLLCACVASTLPMTPLHAGVTRPDPLVITLDGHDYVTWVSPVVFSPGTRLLLAPESSMSNCRRGDSQILPPGLFQLLHTPAGGKIDSIAMRIEFRPTRIIFDTEFGDVICDGEAPGHVTGVGRVFRDEFEPELPLAR